MRQSFSLLGAALAVAPLLIALPMATATAQEDRVCAERTTLAAGLIGQWGELPAVVGTSNSQVMEVWLNPQTGTWTLVITSANGVSCIGAAGEQGQIIEENPVLS